ncbi:hypothetical protein GOBAR_DD14379 [Gossypium barbadense]|nr:hypothetical protein GOBAR_DD14379 [Gossypium barbadense]
MGGRMGESRGQDPSKFTGDDPPFLPMVDASSGVGNGIVQIERVSGPLIIDWVIGQHTHILEWTRRALELEDWQPLSFHQRQVASIVEVFKILEEALVHFKG